MEKTLQKHLSKLKGFDRERTYWLMVSAFVVSAVLGIVFKWDYVVEERLAWAIITSGLTITVCWWYWTMRIIRHLIDAKHDEYIILNDIVASIKEIKEDVKNLPN